MTSVALPLQQQQVPESSADSGRKSISSYSLSDAGPKGQKARVTKDFTARNDEELTIEEDDIVIVIENDGKMCRGHLHGQTGLFPLSHVILLDDDAAIDIVHSNSNPDATIVEAIPEEKQEQNRKWFKEYKRYNTVRNYRTASGLEVTVGTRDSMVGDKRRSKTEEIQLSNEQPSQPTTSGFRLRSKTADMSNSARTPSRISSPTPQSPTGDDTAKSRPSSQFFSSPDSLASRSWVESMGGSEVVEKLNLSKAEIKRQEVIYEMAKTEQDYVKDLDFVLETYITPLRKNKVVRAKDLAIIFSNWEQLLPVNQELLRSLESRRGQNKIVEQVGDIWLRISDYLKIYTMYCSNHPYALVRLEKVMGVKSFSKFCDACAALPESRSMNLASYLIKPVQRICKYPLLVKELIKQTPATHSDHQNLTQALSKIETVVTIVNEAARQTDAVHKMLKIQANFTSKLNIVIPSRQFITSKSFEVLEFGNTRGTMGKKPREVFVFNDMMIMAKSERGGVLGGGGEEVKYKLMGMIPFDHVVIRGQDGHGEAMMTEYFELHSPDDKRSYIFMCETAQIKNQWLEKLSNLITTHQSNLARLKGPDAKLPISAPQPVAAAQDQPSPQKQSKTVSVAPAIPPITPVSPFVAPVIVESNNTPASRTSSESDSISSTVEHETEHHNQQDENELSTSGNAGGSKKVAKLTTPDVANVLSNIYTSQNTAYLSSLSTVTESSHSDDNLQTTQQSNSLAVKTKSASDINSSSTTETSKLSSRTQSNSSVREIAIPGEKSPKHSSLDDLKTPPTIKSSSGKVVPAIPPKPALKPVTPTSPQRSKIVSDGNAMISPTSAVSNEDLPTNVVKPSMLRNDQFKYKSTANSKSNTNLPSPSPLVSRSTVQSQSTFTSPPLPRDLQSREKPIPQTVSTRVTTQDINNALSAVVSSPVDSEDTHSIDDDTASVDSIPSSPTIVSGIPAKVLNRRSLANNANVSKPVKSATVGEVYKTSESKKDYIYVIETTRIGIPQSNIIFHTYEDFFDFHLQLIGHFPEEAGVKGSGSLSPSKRSSVQDGGLTVDDLASQDKLNRIIPEFPPQMMFVTDSVARNRMTLLQNYVNSILSLPGKISRSPVTLAFFKQDGKRAQTILNKLSKAEV